MNNADRVIWNSIVLYSKIIICIVLSLWCVPIILRALGVNDFGLYNLIAGLVAMLAFLKTAMTSSTQRYLSIQRGKGDAQELLSVYNISLLVHWIIACAILILGFALEPWLFNGFLNIEPTRINAAKIIYICLLISTIFTVVAIPYDATLNAYENMPVFAAIEILDQLLRLGLALSLLHINIDRLIFYGVGMASIQVMNFMVKWAYTHYKYKHLYLSLSLFKNPILFRQMFSFASWNTFGAFAIAIRTQGISVIINLFYGTVLNASFGIAQQINGVTSYFSQTLRKSIHPQLMQSEGQQNRQRMLRLAFTSSKFCVLVMGIIAIPLIVEMPYVLKIWLKDIPEYALPFAQYTLIVGLIYQMSSGLMAGILSVGKIKLYQIVISFCMLLVLPISYLLLKLGYSPIFIFYGMISVEILAFIVRLFFGKYLMGLSIKLFACQIIFPLVLSLSSCYAILTGISHFMFPSLFRTILNSMVSVLYLSTISWFFMLNSVEKNHITQFIKHLIPQRFFK